MVIAEHQTWRGLDPEGFERSPESPWLAKRAKGCNGAGRQIALRNNTRTEDRCVRIVALDHPLNPRMATLGAGNYDRRGPGQRRKRLTQPSKREHAASQRIQRVDQYNIPIALQTKMLESVVEQKTVRLELPLHPTADFIAIGADPHVRKGLPDVRLRLVSGLLDGRICPARNDHVQARLAAISSREYRRVPSRFGQLLRQMRDEGRLPCPAHRESADADHGRLELARACMRHIQGVPCGPHRGQRSACDARL